MVDFIAQDLNKFEDQMLHYIEAYHNLLKDEITPDLVDIHKDIDKWIKQIIDLLNIYYKEKKNGLYLRKEDIIKSLTDIKEKKNKKIEFYLILNIAHFLYETHYNSKKLKSNERSEYLENKMTRCIYKEIISLRNRLSHSQRMSPSLELILRLYEDFYYLIKYMKPISPKVKINEQFLREIKINIHIYLEKNLNYDKSFELNSLFDEFKNYEIQNKIIDIEPQKEFNFNEKEINNDTKKLIESIFDFAPIKLPKYDFNKGKKIIKEDEDEKEDEINEKLMYEKSLDIQFNDSLNNSMSNFSSSSERNSINDKSGNIKRFDESEISKSRIDIQNDI